MILIKKFAFIKTPNVEFIPSDNATNGAFKIPELPTARMTLSKRSSLHTGILGRQQSLQHLSTGTLGFASVGNGGKQLLL